MRVLIAAWFSLVAAALVAAVPAKAEENVKAPAKTKAPAPPKAGIKTPGIQIPFGSLKSEAQIPVEKPGLIAIADSVFVPSRSKDLLVRIDPKTNQLLDPVTELKQPCSGAAIAFAALWIPNCQSRTLTRFDPKTGKLTATLASGAADVTLGIAATPDSVWMLTDSKTTLSRIDPGDNKIVAEMRLPAGCNSLAYGETSLWVACPLETRLLRINPATNLVDQRIEVPAGPRAVAFGAGSVWVLCEQDGKVARIDPKTSTVIKTIELSVPNAAGNLAFGDGFLWVSQTGFPLARIDPQAGKERVAQQFWGEGGGLISVSPGAIWLSNVTKGTIARFDPKRVIATLAE